MSPGATRSGLRVPSPSLENAETTSSAVVAVPFLAWSTARLLRARHRWLAGDERARVVLTVAAV